MSKSLFDLSGKVALITGSTQGIGKSMAEELARAGCKVVVSSRKAEACEAVRAEFEKQGFEVLAQPCNISRKEELQALVDKTLAKWGRIDIAMANAAANPYYGPLNDDPGRGLRQGDPEQREKRALARLRSRCRAWPSAAAAASSPWARSAASARVR